MALGSTTSSSSFTGNNSTGTAYTVGFRFDADTDLTVTVTNAAGVITTLTDGVDYTLAGSGQAGTATFTTAVAYDNTNTVKCVRNSSQLQAYTPSTPLDTTDLETAFDRTMMAVQDNRRDTDTKLDTTDIVDSLTSTATDQPLSAAQGKALKDTADTLATTVAGKVATADIVDNLTSTDPAVPLSAKQGKALKDATDAHIGNTANPHSVTPAQLGLVIGSDVQAHSATLDATTAAFTTALASKLAGIETSADVTATANVTAAGALMDSEVTSLSGIKSLTVPDSTTISTFGATLTDDADAAAARTTLGLSAAATLSTSTGGNGLADNGKIVIFNTNGGIIALSNTSSGVALTGETTGLVGTGVHAKSSTAAGKALLATADNGGQALSVGNTSTIHLSVSGNGDFVTSATLATSIRAALGIPTYADLTAANAALNAGDIYFDSSLSVLRAATA